MNIPYICRQCEVESFNAGKCPICGAKFERNDLTEKEYDELAQESYDNLVRSCIEAGGEIRVARELLSRSLEMLYLLGYDSSFTNSSIDTLTKDIKEFLGGR